MEEKYTTIKERVIYFAKLQGVAVDAFLSEIGMTYGSFKGKAKLGTLNSSAIEEIYTKYPQINLEWLITGRGKVTKEEIVEKNISSDLAADTCEGYEVNTWKKKYDYLNEKYTALLEEHNALLKRNLNEVQVKDKSAAG